MRKMRKLIYLIKNRKQGLQRKHFPLEHFETKQTNIVTIKAFNKKNTSITAEV